MTARPLRILHAIHDFLPRHQAGSELYADALARHQAARHHVTVLCAEFDPARDHGSVHWRMHGGLPVVEIVNNWECAGFEDTYRPASLRAPLDHVLRATAPDVVHVHNLLNLSFDLPGLAHAHGAAVVATLHDFTVVCPSGGQRVHRADRYVCHDIEPARCARCFGESPFAERMAAARLAPDRRSGRMLARAVRMLRQHAPTAAAVAARRAAALTGTRHVSAREIARRLDAARDTLATLDLVIAPSAFVAEDLARFGLARDRTIVSDYGFEPLAAAPRDHRTGPLRVGFVGTLTWHKGAHVLLQAARTLPRDAVDLRIAGDPHVFPEYGVELRRLAEGLPVTFTGRFDRADTASIYAGLDVLVVPSLWPENSPLVIHEAFMAGVAVVAARAGGIPGLITDGVSGLLFDASSPESLANALRRLIEDPGLVDRLAAASPAVRSMDQDAAEWEARYRAVADVAGRRPA